MIIRGLITLMWKIIMKLKCEYFKKDARLEDDDTLFPVSSRPFVATTIIMTVKVDLFIH